MIFTQRVESTVYRGSVRRLEINCDICFLAIKKIATWVFSPKKLHFCLKKILWDKIREQSDKNRG